MGTEAVWVPLAISALSAGASVYNQQQQAHKAEDISNDLMRTQQRKQHEADALVNENVGRLKASTGDAERQASLQGFLQQLRQNSNPQSGGVNVPGASDRFQQDTASGKAAIQNFGTGRADIMSRIMGPTLQRINENAMTARTGSDVAGVAREASGDAWLQQLRQQKNVLNPWISAASQFGNGVAGGMASSGFGVPDAPLETPAITATRMSYVPPALRRAGTAGAWGG